MALYHRIPVKYMTLIPALVFAAIGSLDIIFDALHHKLTIADFLFNLIFFIPLVVRHRWVYVVSGVIAMLFAGYAFFALLVWFVQYLNGAHFRYLFDTFVIGPLFMFLFFCLGLSLTYGGRRSEPKEEGSIIKDS